MYIMRFLHSQKTLIKTAAICLLSLLQPTIVLAAENPLTITNAWIQEAPPNAKMMAGYMSLTNNSNTPVTVRSVTSQSFREIGIHRTLYKDGMAKMISLESLTIPGQGAIIFEPGSYHLMMFSPEKTLSSGDKVTVSLQMKNGPTIKQIFLVQRNPAATGNEDHHQHHHH